ncbi:MAG: hypothetical protein AAFX99_20045, partial [Myxococcota bacterium]
SNNSGTSTSNGSGTSTSNGSGTSTSNGSGSTGTSSSGTGTTGTSNGPNTTFNFVLVEDMSPNSGGESPAADIDSISTTIQGIETFATSVEDFSLGGGSNLDTNQALGAPDSGCTATNFVSIGGVGGYLLVSFGRSFSSGDAVTVYELGPTTCPNQTNWIDEDYRILISISSNLSDFIEIGQGGAGVNTVVIP